MSTEEEADRLKGLANDAFKANDLTKSVMLYTEALAHAHRNSLDSIAVLYSNRSCAMLKLGRLEHALADADKAIEGRPDWAKAHSRKGAALRLMDRNNEAYFSYLECCKLEPENQDFRDTVKQLKDSAHCLGGAQEVNERRQGFVHSTLRQTPFEHLKREAAKFGCVPSLHTTPPNPPQNNCAKKAINSEALNPMLPPPKWWPEWSGLMPHPMMRWRDQDRWPPCGSRAMRHWTSSCNWMCCQGEMRAVKRIALAGEETSRFEGNPYALQEFCNTLIDDSSAVSFPSDRLEEDMISCQQLIQFATSTLRACTPHGKSPYPRIRQ